MAHLPTVHGAAFSATRTAFRRAAECERQLHADPQPDASASVHEVDPPVPHDRGRLHTMVRLMSLFGLITQATAELPSTRRDPSER